MEVSSLPVTKFKTMLISMSNKLRRRMEKLSENINLEVVSLKKDIKTILKSQK